jgi:hypothetical protein
MSSTSAGTSAASATLPAARAARRRTPRRPRDAQDREADLARAYESEVDPRLNYEQAMELAFLIARKMKNGAH